MISVDVGSEEGDTLCMNEGRQVQVVGFAEKVEMDV